ncbi:MAG: indolepyruvate oxidoreductase subunit beta [Chloroflexi bacterium]|nr:indolepyruvate oxidoreductase subunit beta [Chloroflexota bacterium]
MKYDVILSGVGGQGVLSIAAIIGIAAVNSGLHLKQAEVHGMSQRGGAVESHLRYGSRPIYSDLVPHGKADMILSMEPMEGLRYVGFLSADGVIVTEKTPFINIPDYPEIDTVYGALEQYPHVTLIDAQGIAKAMRAARSSNMVLLGAASVYMPLELAQLEAGIREVFGRKGEKVVASNLEALHRGREAAQD